MPFDSRIEIRDATLDDAPALAALSAQLGYANEPDLRQRPACLLRHSEPVWLAECDGQAAWLPLRPALHHPIWLPD